MKHTKLPFSLVLYDFQQIGVVPTIKSYIKTLDENFKCHHSNDSCDSNESYRARSMFFPVLLV